jgi:hypothetical protein
MGYYTINSQCVVLEQLFEQSEKWFQMGLAIAISQDTLLP